MESVAISGWIFTLLIFAVWIGFVIAVICFVKGFFGAGVTNEHGELNESEFARQLWQRKGRIILLVLFLVIAIVFPMESSKWRPKTDPNDNPNPARQELEREIRRADEQIIIPAEDTTGQVLDQIQEEEEQKVDDILERFKSLPDANPVTGPTKDPPMDEDKK